jgi:hypothetical protein
MRLWAQFPVPKKGGERQRERERENRGGEERERRKEGRERKKEIVVCTSRVNMERTHHTLYFEQS